VTELLTKKETAKWAKTSTRQIDLLVKRGAFPAPIRLSQRSPRWRRADLEAFTERQTPDAAGVSPR